MERRIVIDIDDTSIPVDEVVFSECQEELKSYPNEATARGILNSTFPAVRTLRQERVKNPHWIKELKPYPQTKEAYRKLFERGYQIIVATARNRTIARATRISFKELGLAPFVHKYLFRPNSIGVVDFKLMVNEVVHPVATFEDNGIVSPQIASRHSLIYVIQRPWNQHLQEDDYLKLRPSLYEGVESFLNSQPLFLHHISETPYAMN